MDKTRLKLGALGVSFALLANVAFAQGQAEIAAKLNEEGKAFMYVDKYAEASAKFRDAVARVPEAKYFYNLCASLYKEGKFGEALTACNATSNSDTATPQLKQQADKLSQGVREEAKRQGVNVEPVGGGASDPNCATTPADPRCQPKPDICAQNPQDPSCMQVQPPPPQPTYAQGKPPQQDILAAGSSDNKYTWTLGVELFGGGGKIGRKDYYGTAAGGIRIKGDYLLNSVKRIGAQGYFTYSRLGQGDEQMGLDVERLDIIDFGAALYKHFCVKDRLCLTPLGGAHIALMSPNVNDPDTDAKQFEYAAVGARLELGAHIGFGSRNEHVLGIGVGTNVYSAVFSGPSDTSGSLSVKGAGLDKGGAVGYLSIGYTYRFNTPLGSSPFVTLQ